MQYSWYFDELIGGTEPWHTITQCVTEDFSDNLEGEETIQETHSNKITCANCGSYSEVSKYVTSS